MTNKKQLEIWKEIETYYELYSGNRGLTPMARSFRGSFYRQINENLKKVGKKHKFTFYKDFEMVIKNNIKRLEREIKNDK